MQSREKVLVSAISELPIVLQNLQEASVLSQLPLLKTQSNHTISKMI